MNKSRTYILPLVERELKLDLPLLHHLVNTYAYCTVDQIEVAGPSITLELNKGFLDHSDFGRYKKEITESNLFIYYCIKNKYCYYVLKIPDDFMNDYYLLLEGKYSQISTKAKGYILGHLHKFYTHRLEKVHEVWKILNKDVSLRRQLEERLNTSLSDEDELSTKMISIDETITI